MSKKKLSITDFLAADSLNEQAASFYLSEHDTLNSKIKILLNRVKEATSVNISNVLYTNSITTANNLYFYTLDETTNEIVLEYMILTECIIDVKIINPSTYKIVSENELQSIIITLV